MLLDFNSTPPAAVPTGTSEGITEANLMSRMLAIAPISTTRSKLYHGTGGNLLSSLYWRYAVRAPGACLLAGTHVVLLSSFFF